MAGHLPQFLGALFIGGDLGCQVGHVLARVAGRIGAIGQQRQHFLFPEPSFPDELEIVDQHAFLFDGGAPRGHGTGGDAPDVGMVAAGTDVKQQGFPRFVEHGGDNGDIGKMGAAVVGRVQGVNVAGFHAALVFGNHHLDAFAHGA